jgi:hypothetical protein
MKGNQKKKKIPKITIKKSVWLPRKTQEMEMQSCRLVTRWKLNKTVNLKFLSLLCLLSCVFFSNQTEKNRKKKMRSENIEMELVRVTRTLRDSIALFFDSRSVGSCGLVCIYLYMYCCCLREHFPKCSSFTLNH